VAGEALELAPQEDRPLALAQARERLLRLGVHDLGVGAVDDAPLGLVEHVDGERVRLPRRGRDAVGVVLDEDEEGELFLHREADRLVEIPLPRGRIADGGDDDAVLAVELQAPGHAAGGQELRAERRRHADDVELPAREVRRHHAAARGGGALGEILEREVLRRHPASEAEAAVAIVGQHEVPLAQLHADGAERLMAASGDMEVALALAIEAFLAQITEPALEHRAQEMPALFLVQCGRRSLGHGGGRVGEVTRPSSKPRRGQRILPGARRFSRRKFARGNACRVSGFGGRGLPTPPRT
jgi:hypothetical protein